MNRLMAKGDLITYQYSLDPRDEQADFEFNTLAEVGEPYKKWFVDQINKRGWMVKHGVDLEYYPWVADLLVGFHKEDR